MGGRGGVDRNDTAWGFKNFTGGSRPRVKRILRRIRKRLMTVLARLGPWERLILICVQEFGLWYQFRVADIAVCIEKRCRIPNHGGRLNHRIHDAVTRLIKRKIIMKKGRGVYALRKELARISALGFPLVVEPVFFPSQDTEKRRKALRKAVKNHVTSSLQDTENLSTAARHGSCIGNGGNSINSITSNGITNSDVISSNDGITSIGSDGIGTPNLVGSGFVIRAHVINPRGGWVGYYMSVSVAFHVLGFVRGLVREYLAELYGETFVGNLDKSIETVAKALPNAEFVIGCHGRYGNSPGRFSPLIPECKSHNYEYGIDTFLPSDLGDVLHGVSFTKIYIKKLMEGRNLFHGVTAE